MCFVFALMMIFSGGHSLPSATPLCESCSVVSHSLRTRGLYSHGILQARILEWAAFPFSRGSSQPRDQTQVSRIAGRFFTNWAIREAPAFTSSQNFTFGTFESIRKKITLTLTKYVYHQGYSSCLSSLTGKGWEKKISASETNLQARKEWHLGKKCLPNELGKM